ncbi:MAG: hypothetical protein ACRC63_00990 [Metamycoplasmataceae bacterium]
MQEKSPFVKDLSLEEIEKRLIDCKDTREHLLKTQWNANLKLSKEQFEENTKYALGMVERFENELLKAKKGKENNE